MPSRSEPGEDEAVDRVPGPGLVLDLGRLGPIGGRERPVASQDAPCSIHRRISVDLLGGELLARVRRRHPELGHFLGDPEVQLALVGVAGDDRRVAAEVGGDPVRRVEPEVGLALGRIGAVASKQASERIGRMSRAKLTCSPSAAR